MNISTHFSLDEFINSQTAARQGIDNTPTDAVICSLQRTALGLELVRTLLGAPIIISSGYRSPALNKAVGGAANSQHLTGEAVDFTCPGFGTPAQVASAIKWSTIPFGQVIEEFSRWVHISFDQNNRRQALVIDGNGTRLASIIPTQSFPNPAAYLPLFLKVNHDRYPKP